MNKPHFVLMGILGVCLAAVRCAPADAPQRPAQAAASIPAVTSPVSINAEMVRIV